MFSLFSEHLIQKRLANFIFPEDLHDRQAIVNKWHQQLNNPEQTPNIHEFLHDLFVEALGYQSPFNETKWELELEPKVALGFFDEREQIPIVSINYTDLIEQPEQTINAPSLQWQIVITPRHIILHPQQEPIFREIFRWQDLHNLGVWQRFYLLFCRRTLLPRFIDTKSHAQILREESQEQELVNLKQIYHHITGVREYLIKDFRHRLSHLPNHTEVAHKLAMKLLRRIIFIAYAGSHQLLPNSLLADAYEFFNPYQNQSAWDNYKVIFKWLQQGNSRLKEQLPLYTCSLFAVDSLLDETLYVGDEICRQLKEITKYNWRDEISDTVFHGLLELILYPTKKRLFKHPSKYLLSADTVLVKLAQAPLDNLENILIVDKQCRAGTLLVCAFHFLVANASNDPATPQFILQNCLYGSDPDPEAIAMTKLNLWLAGLPHTAPVPELEDHICNRLEIKSTPSKTVINL